MATLYKENRSAYRIQFADGNGNRKSVRLGKMPKKAAETVRSRVEEILACRLAVIPLSTETASWLGNVPDELYEKLAGAALVPPRRSALLGTYLDAYIERRKDVKPGTVIRWNLDRKKLVDFFGEDCRVNSVTDIKADDFKQHLFSQGLAQTTISKHLANAKMFFDAMLAENLIRANPFAKVAVTAVVNENRNVYVPRERIAAAPDNEWRLIIALSRFGGLRSPSEILSLEWSNINWTKMRMLVVSPKTERHPNGMQRLVPIFAELFEPLRNAWNSRSEGARHVIATHRSQADGEMFKRRGWVCCNLRKPFMDILNRAGLKPWPKLFHAMRASCETDLVDAGYPIQAVTAWMGHSPRIAQKHYLRQREEYFDRAVRCGGGEAKDDSERESAGSRRSFGHNDNGWLPSQVTVGPPTDALKMTADREGETDLKPKNIPETASNNNEGPALPMVQKAVRQASAKACRASRKTGESPQIAGPVDAVPTLANHKMPKRGLEQALFYRDFLTFFKALPQILPHTIFEFFGPEPYRENDVVVTFLKI